MGKLYYYHFKCDFIVIIVSKSRGNCVNQSEIEPNKIIGWKCSCPIGYYGEYCEKSN